MSPRNKPRHLTRTYQHSGVSHTRRSWRRLQWGLGAEPRLQSSKRRRLRSLQRRGIITRTPSVPPLVGSRGGAPASIIETAPVAEPSTPRHHHANALGAAFSGVSGRSPGFNHRNGAGCGAFDAAASSRERPRCRFSGVSGRSPGFNHRNGAGCGAFTPRHHHANALGAAFSGVSGRSPGFNHRNGAGCGAFNAAASSSRERPRCRL